MDYFVNGERATALVFEIILLAVATCSAQQLPSDAFDLRILLLLLQDNQPHNRAPDRCS